MVNKDAEYEQFNDTMDTLLRANPVIVKAAMEEEKRARKENRQAKRAPSGPASSNRDA